MTERARRWSEGTGRSIVAVVMLVVGVALPTVFFRLPLALAPLLMVAGAALLLAAGARAGALRWWRQPMAVALVVLIGVGLLSVAWSPVPERGLLTVLKLVALCLAGSLTLAGAALLPGTGRARLTLGLGLGAALVALYVVMDLATGFRFSQAISRVFGHEPAMVTIHQWGRGPFMLAVLVWPVSLALASATGPRRLRVALAALALAAVGIGLLFMAAEAATVAFYAAAGVALVGYVSPVWARRLLASALALAVLAGPPAVLSTVGPEVLASALPESAPQSWQHRLLIWSFSLERIAERPLIGWGLDASRAIPGGSEPPAGLGDRFARLPLHPHNAVLQVWLELGVVGAIALSAVVVALARSLARRFPVGPDGPVDQRLAHAMTLATWTSVAVLASFSFGAWQSWWIAALWVLGALLVALTAPAERG